MSGEGDHRPWPLVTFEDTEVWIQTPRPPGAPDLYAMADDREWPSPLRQEAFQGPLGDYVLAVAPHTEGDPAAIIGQALVAAGNYMGREGPYFEVQGSRHGTNLYLAVVGQTARARKGTSQAPALAPFRDLGEWSEQLDMEAGLSTGEGLIHHVRDATSGIDKQTGQLYLADPGVKDKRLLAIESEFASVLSRMRSEGSSLSQIARLGWDGRTLSTKTRRNPMTASKPHISIIAHVTEADLRAMLMQQDVSNGFGNRFLWVMAKRHGFIARDNGWRPAQHSDQIEAIADALAWARERPRQIDFDRLAGRHWDDVYEAFDHSDQEGKGAAMTARGEAQVRRLATVYAALDRSPKIKNVHLKAALEFWRYCEESALYLFGSDPENPEEANALRLLRTAGAVWVPRSAVAEHMKSKPGKVVRAALDALVEKGYAERRTEKTKGRPRTDYRVKRRRRT